MDINAFIRLRRPRWEKLSRLLDTAEQRGLAGLSPEEVDTLYRLYRLASSDLTWAQTQTGNPALLEFLESTVARAYGLLTPPARARPLRAWWRAVRHTLPALVRSETPLFALAAGLLLAGALFGGMATAADPDLAAVFLPPEHLDETPSQRVAGLEELEAAEGQIDGVGGYAFFSSYLFTHNIRVCLLAFGLGLTFGVGTAVVLFFNGAMLGCIAYWYFADGVGTFFVAWVGPHGSIELPCVVFAGLGGLMLARAQLSCDQRTVWQRVVALRRPLTGLVVATATWLVVAGLIEGGFSQVNEPTLPYPLKITVAAGLFVALLAYLFVVRVAPLVSGQEDAAAARWGAGDDTVDGLAGGRALAKPAAGL